MKIAVLTGGTSTERDVSIVTSTNVCKALRKKGHDANVIDVFFGSDEYADAEALINDIVVQTGGTVTLCECKGSRSKQNVLEQMY